MVPVKKPIIAAKAPEASAPQKRRPRNQELNSSMKNAVPKVRRSLNSSMASDIDRLVGAVKASNATDYDEKFEVLGQSDAYEEQLMADAYYEAEQELSKKYGIPNVMLETSVQHGRGRVDAFTDGGEPGCATLGSYNFQEETEAVWDIIKSWSGDTAGLVDAVAQKIVDLVEVSAEDYERDRARGENGLNSSENQSANCAEGLNCDASGISGAQDLLQKFVDDAASKYHTNLTLKWKPYSWKWSPEKTSIQYVIQEHTENSDGDYTMSKITVHPSEVQEFANSVNTFIRETVIPYLVDNAPEVDRIHGLFDDGTSYLQLGDFDTDSPDVDKNDYEEELDSSKNQSMNCAEDESGTIYTESGNQVAITDIKVVQNPETNALALFVPENGDDEIPEGFTVIGDVIATASGAPAIEENAETGDDSLNSSKKPPMNRAQRRAAQRGARRPKKR